MPTNDLPLTVGNPLLGYVAHPVSDRCADFLQAGVTRDADPDAEPRRALLAKTPTRKAFHGVWLFLRFPDKHLHAAILGASQQALKLFTLFPHPCWGLAGF